MNPNGRATGGASHLRRLVACSALIVGAVGCAPSSVSDGSASLPGASPRESAAASPAVTGEPSPSARTPDAATPSPESALANDAIGRVIVTDLVTRSAPGVGEDSRILEMGLTDGDLVYVIAGPVPADGYEWLLVAELAPRFSSQAAGWIAPASREGETWLEPVQPAALTTDAVYADTGVQLVRSGDSAILLLGWRALSFREPVRVVGVIDEPTRRGFSYGTLPGHPLSGEELFVVERRDDDSVWLTIRSISRPAAPVWWALLPLVRLVQAIFLSRYEHALTRPLP